ncbi:iron ABC transporter permease [Gloeocapsa sp. PCC 73106]|uniref:ABC transporter permease n=1 Tax=Gloeocapsa sp. PCC 73106 TaxID=102232 RepID=UPI0002AC567E|nr:iron ABC transporter permease [Gloeocapsa sp. PCC 73106]ELR98058.1 ABC-type Fe3+ transport system, permease component [Gloeocapsa sp. PCC 73106]
MMLNFFSLLVIGIAVLIATPVLFIFTSIFSDAGEVWQHLASTVLQDYITNSLWLILGVGTGVLVIGVGTAWLVTMCNFWLRGLFEWALLLPLAAPAYLLAYTYTNMLDYFGPVQTTLRKIFNWTSVQDYWFPTIRSLPGAIAMLTLVLYPYVYMLARVAFLEQSTGTLEASRSLGCTPLRSFWAIALPLARPSIMAGLALALMETLNDFGTVSYFGVTTFTTGIYRTWLGLGQRAAAAQLAAFLMIFVLILIILERWSRSQARYYQTGARRQQTSRYNLNYLQAGLAWIACFIPLALGFIAPGLYLFQMTWNNLDQAFENNFFNLAQNSLILSCLSAFVAVFFSLIIAYVQRLQAEPVVNAAVRIAGMGYAIPGSVIAVGVLIPLGNFDNWIDAWLRTNFNISTGLLVSGTITGLIFAYLVRFFAVSLGAIESSLQKIKPSLDDAARSLGHNPFSNLVTIHTPMMWGGILTAGMLVFVDVMKELPATLVMRPFNFDTLAIRVYQYASDERLVEAAAPALAIILVGIIPVIFLSVKITNHR